MAFLTNEEHKYSFPSDILSNVFSMFGLKQKIRASQVSHLWKDIVYDKILWRDVKIDIQDDTDEQQDWSSHNWLNTMIPSLIQRHIIDVMLEVRCNSFKRSITNKSRRLHFFISSSDK